MDYDSVENQRIKEKFVQREVLACFSWELGVLLRLKDTTSDEDLPSWEDVQGLYQFVCPECRHGVQSLEGIQSEVDERSGELVERNIWTCPSCQEVSEKEWESEPQEVYEWWMVSEWFAKKLETHGEPILDWGNHYYWGRTCTGQAILLDHVISEICREEEILVGQKYSWFS